MKRYLLIDDIRSIEMVMPAVVAEKAGESFTIDVARTYMHGVRLLYLSMKNNRPYDVLLLDHDLGDESERNGYQFIKYFLDICHGRRGQLLTGRLKKLPKRLECVSDNGPGRANIISIFETIERLRNDLRNPT